jgi:hypothetical protein
MSRMKQTAFLLVGSLLFLAVGARADITIGSPLVQGTYPGTDFCTGCLFAYEQIPVAAVGQTVTSWAFYAAATPTDPAPSGNMITPLIFQSNGGGSFTVVGIGTTQTSSTPGTIQSHAFGLVSGTDVLAAGDYIGWRDGGTGVGTGNNGSISLDLGPPPAGPGVYYFGLPAYSGSVANLDTFSFTNAGTDERTYSIEFTATPEPMYYGVLGMGLTMLLVFRRFLKA